MGKKEKLGKNNSSLSCACVMSFKRLKLIYPNNKRLRIHRVEIKL